jgi:ATP-binding cassette subfamily F protein 3
MREMERLMGERELLQDRQAFDRLSAEYASLAEDFRNKGGYEFRANIKSVLHGLKFGEEYHQRITATLSGGQKTRLAMARLLLSRPAILILDEPTNHLDMETLAWLEKYLQSYPGSILVVSHDRYFLDALVHTVYELDRGKLFKYAGNYSRFISQKEEQRERERKLYDKQQREIARTEDFIRRNIARASTTGRAQSRRKALEKIDRLEQPVDFKGARFSFSIERPSAREVLAAKALSVGYRDNTLSEGIDLIIERGQRVAIIGPNGSGKSTLLKTAAGTLKPLKGHLALGAYVSTGYYDQEQARLEGTHRVLDEIWNRFPHMDEKDVRGLLGSFLFSGDDVFKTVDSLSGGEKARLALAVIMLRQANFLLLDEPTNHLDVYSREVLEKALQDYDGTILFVSHDRYFLNKISTRVLEITPRGLIGFPGNYDHFLDKRSQADSAAQPAPVVSAEKEAARQSYLKDKETRRTAEKMKKRAAQLETAIEETERSIRSLEEELYLPETSRDLNLLMQKSADLEKFRKELDSLYAQWELATLSIEEYEML